MRRIQCNAKQFNPGIGPALKYDRPALKYDRLTLKEGEGGKHAMPLGPLSLQVCGICVGILTACAE